MKIITVNDVIAQKKNHDFYLERDIFRGMTAKSESLGRSEVLVLFSISSP